MARINAVALCQTPELNVDAWAFFKRWYLDPRPDGEWYLSTSPGIKAKLPSPPCHYLYVNDVHAFPRNVIIFPRSFAKTTLMLENVLRWTLIRRSVRVLMVKSGWKFVKEDFIRLMRQYTDNALIVEDFGELKPPKGMGSWAVGGAYLRNGSAVVGIPVEGSVHGFRPNIWFLDDAEFDPAMQICPTYKTEQLRYLMLNGLEPQLDPGNIGVFQGTLINRRSLGYEIATKSAKEEPRWSSWNRVIIPAKTPTGELMWPEKFPDDRLDERKESLGAAAFAAQMMNAPGSESDRILQIHPTMSFWWVENPDDEFVREPLYSSASMISYLAGRPKFEGEPLEPVQVSRNFGEAARKMWRVILVDPAQSERSTADYSAVICLGLENSRQYRDTLWALDLELQRVDPSGLSKLIWSMARKWRPKIIGIESAATQITFADRVNAEIDQYELDGWRPIVVPIKYTGDLKVSKPARIMTLVTRFEQYRVRFPADLWRKAPWKDLAFQIENFTADLKLLKHDDALDALAMFGAIHKGRRVRHDAEPDRPPPSIAEMIEQGLEYYPGTRIRLMALADPTQLPDAALDKWMKRQYNRGRGRGRRPAAGSVWRTGSPAQQ